MRDEEGGGLGAPAGSGSVRRIGRHAFVLHAVLLSSAFAVAGFTAACSDGAEDRNTAAGDGTGDTHAQGDTNTNSHVPIPTSYFLAFPTNSSIGSVPDLVLKISGLPSTTGVVNAPGGVSQPFDTGTAGSVEVSLPASLMLDAFESLLAKGIVIDATDRVDVIAVSDLQLTGPAFSLDTFTLLPDVSLGVEHRVVAAGSGITAGSLFCVVATEDGTTVTVTTTANAGGHAVGSPRVVTLNRLDAYQVRADGAADDLTGSLIESDKPVAVFGGHQAANVPANTSSASFVLTQIPPVANLGSDYVVAPLATRTVSTLRILAARDNTTVVVSGVPDFMLVAGEYRDIDLTAAKRVVSTQPVLAAVLSHGAESDGTTVTAPFVAVARSVGELVPTFSFDTPSRNIASRWVNIVTRTTETSLVALDGVAVGSTEFAVVGSGEFSVAQLALAAGSHEITTGGAGFVTMVYGFGDTQPNGFGF